jgi:gluconolactonase
MERRKFLKSAAALGATVALPGATSAGAESKPAANPAQNLYPLGPDSKPQPGVPIGKVFDFAIADSKFFPGTERTIHVYVPAQYAAEKPACVWVALDGLSATMPIVFDNLIHKKEIPVTIAIGLQSGTTQSVHPPKNPRFDRSCEFDSLTGVLGDFILQELLPRVEKQKTPDGLSIMLSSDPNYRGISGASTGGIGAFTTAWQHPEAFRRVYTEIGTFVGMRGGDRYPVLIRKTEPKPLRVFMQDGDKDGWPGGLEFGDWWMSNQAMERALTFAGYSVNHAWGVLGHDGRQGESILPDVMRWLWKDWPRPVEAGQTSNFVIQAIMEPGEDWQLVREDRSSIHNTAGGTENSERVRYVSPPLVRSHSTAAAMASDGQGRVYVQNPSNGVIDRLGATGDSEPFAQVSPGDNGLALGPDGRLYVAETGKARILACDRNGKISVIAENIPGRRLTVAHNGNIYVCEATGDRSYSGKVWLLRRDGGKSVVAEGLNGPSGICLAPDGLWLCVAESNGHHAYSYQVQPDGALRFGEPFYWFHVPDSASNSGATQVCMDRQGWAYAATRMGVQVFDRNGRVTAILPVSEKQLTGICFGDSDFQTLYVTTGNAVYRRRVKAVGMPAWQAPITLPPSKSA